MPLLRTVAGTLTNNDLVAGVIEEIIDRDQLFAQLPFTRVDGKAYVYNREADTSWDHANVDTLDNSIEPAFTDVGTAIAESAAKFTEITTNLRTLIGDVDVDKFLQATHSNTNDQRAIQIAQKAKAIARKFRRTLIQGNNGVNGLEFSGLAALSTDAYARASQTFASQATPNSSGATLTFDMLDRLLDLLPNGADALIMRPSVLRAYRQLVRAAYGTTPESIMLENFGMAVPAHNGVPILVNEFLPFTETHSATAPAATGGVLTSVFAARFNEVDGLHGLYGGDNAGIVIEDLGTVQNKDATRTRLKWYCGLALKSSRSLARLTGVSNV